MWNSGYLEHGGTVQCVPTADAKSPASYYISVDLSWNGTAPVYNYTETFDVNEGDVYTRNYYGSLNGNLADPVYENVGASEMSLRGVQYTIAITPVQFKYERDISKGKYMPASSLMLYDYPRAPLNNKASSYVTTEVHHVKNGSFCFTKSNTDNLLDVDLMQIYTYHTTGFVKRSES